MLTALSKIFGTSNDRQVARLRPIVAKINGFEESISPLSDEALRGKTGEFRQRLVNGETLDSILPEAYAVVREAAKRVLGQRHFDVQMMGGIVLHQGKIAEMRTGEGKTLVSTLPSYLNALTGQGVHVVTVNDYLARRDAEWMGRIHRFLGLSVGVIIPNMADPDRRAAYAADITYGTNNEFGFDYLRDNMKYRLEDMVQRDFNFAIVDEVDSILIDEARTPLIISGLAEDSSELYKAINVLMPGLRPEHYDLDEKTKQVNLTEEGTEFIERQLEEKGLLHPGTTSMYDSANVMVVHHVMSALRAHQLFRRDVDYVIKNDKIIIIDEFTGRMMEGRRYSEGLHQAIEAKENVTIQQENQTLASVTFQNYFRLYPKLAGMTGTALTEAAEFADIYKLDVVDIPTNLPVSREDQNDKIYKDFDDKFEAIVNLIEECQQRKQPVLVGTTSIEKSEKLSEALKKRKIAHQVLNARHHENEASIIAQAGRPGAVTIATNMAGRGTDIQLGGNLDMRVAHETPADASEAARESKRIAIAAEVAAEKEIVLKAGGLCVIGTERHESRRIDNQLRGRSGRQGDPGLSVFFLALDDDLMRIFGADKLQPLMASAKFGLKPGESLTHPLISKTLERAQLRVESHNFDIRKNLLKFDNVMNDQRKVVYEQRREIMGATDLSDTIDEMRHDLIDGLVARTIPAGSYADMWDVEALAAGVKDIANLDLPIAEWAAEEGIADEEIRERIIRASNDMIGAKRAMATPIMFAKYEKGILLQTLDHQWKEHLHALDYLRQGIGLRSFAQRDPLNEYKAEAFELFQTMLQTVREITVRTLSHLDIQPLLEQLGVSVMPRAAAEPTQTPSAKASQ